MNYIGDDMDSFLDILFELVLTVFVEGFVEGFVSLCTVFVPQKKLSHKATKIITWICVITSLLLLVGLFAGIVILGKTRGQNLWGWLLIAINVVYLLAGITLKLFSHIKAKSRK